MSKKDHRLSNIFDAYMENMEPPKKLSEPASALLRAQNAESEKHKAVKRKLVSRMALSFGAVSIVAIILFSYLIYSLSGYFNNKPEYYSATALAHKTISATEVAEIENSLTLDSVLFPLTAKTTDAKYTLVYFINTDKPAFIICKTRHEFNGNVLDMKITAELTDKYIDEYRHFFDYKTYETENAKIHAYQRYENGEYITEAAFKNQGIKYYVETLSPVPVDALDYYRIILD